MAVCDRVNCLWREFAFCVLRLRLWRVNCLRSELTCGHELPFGHFGTLRVVIYNRVRAEPSRNCTLHIANCKIEYSRVRAEPAVNVPKAHIIAEGNIISEAASFALQGKHHSRPGEGEARHQCVAQRRNSRSEARIHARLAAQFMTRSVNSSLQPDVGVGAFGA